MPAALVSVGALLLGAAILLLGNGLIGILLPVRATFESFSTVAIGLIASGYSAGFVLGCLSVPHIVRRVGHIRTFAVMAAIAASAILLMALLVEPVAWILLRAVSGLAFAGLYMVIESWLNERASNTNRGQLFATYMVIQLGAITAGQMLLPVGDAAGFGLFAVATIAITLALVPVSLTSSSAPQPLETVRLRLARLYRMSPVGVLGCFFVGLANGAFGGLGVVFAQGVGLGTTGVALFMSAALVGGTLFQVPFGRLSDRIDRRRVLMLACLLAVIAGAVLALAGKTQGDAIPAWLARIAALPSVLIGAVVVFGGCIFSMYSLCVAHTNDFVAREDFVEASSGLLLTWAVGATLGPIAAGPMMEWVGLGGLFLYAAVVHLLFIAFIWYRTTRRACLPPEARPDFVQAGHTRTSHVLAAMDPRAPEPPASEAQATSDASSAPREAMK
ncbi:MAG TPA: MFS transporter [Geminicoccaceae bacterium]|nr:MFS transporter [Geminicoccaceae bacterium]